MDDISTSTLCLILGVLVICSAYFSATETAMMALNPYRLKAFGEPAPQWCDSGNAFFTTPRSTDRPYPRWQQWGQTLQLRV
ncbi:MAG: hypothetical protein U5L01_15735 [Rheinheimera sp.]|nr:hypothetical protein [Rheinheimera sp.]